MIFLNDEHECGIASLGALRKVEVHWWFSQCFVISVGDLTLI